jgi:hypothetical protein
MTRLTHSIISRPSITALRKDHLITSHGNERESRCKGGAVRRCMPSRHSDINEVKGVNRVVYYVTSR